MAIITQSTTFEKTISHDDAMVAELRENPEYAEIYLQTALEDIYEEGGIAAFLTALRRVVEVRGGVGEIRTVSPTAIQSAV